MNDAYYHMLLILLTGGSVVLIKASVDGHS